MSLRLRLWLSFAPLVVLLTGLGVAVILSLRLVGDRIGDILRENYRSVEAMAGLDEALERIDSSFLSALAGRPDARRQYDDYWAAYRTHLHIEQSNITEPGEDELVERLTRLTDRYRALGDRFFVGGRSPAERAADYPALLGCFQEIKTVSGEIRRLNQASMEAASRAARETAAKAQGWAVLGLLAVVAATGFLARHTARTILRPVEDLTRSAQAVGDGRFDQMVPAATHDEIGELVAAFNRMTAQLRDLRQSQAARLLRAQQTSQATIDSFPDPVLVVDVEGRVEMANPAARRLLGVEPSGEQPGAPWTPPEPLRGPLAEAVREQRPHLPGSFDQAVTFRVGGEERIFLPQVLPVRDPYGGSLGAAVVLTDVTRFRLLDQFKSDLVATASHELKTPLTSVRLAVHLLLQETIGPLTPKQTELLLDARENTERLVRIVEHLLSLARLEEGREELALRPEDPEALLRSAAELARPLAEGKRLEVAVAADHPLPRVNADAQRLGGALGNLLTNAVTYTEPGGRIVLAARAVGDGTVELTVSDTGVGIPPEHLPHVFDRFFRIPGQSRGQGTGLGLAIVREVVTAHGGQITCESEPGRGTTFRVTLPAAGPLAA